MTWRPEGWVDIKTSLMRKHRTTDDRLLEETADSILDALKRDSGDPNWTNPNSNPPEKGWLIFIPDERSH